MARRPARGPSTRPVWTRLGVLAVVLVAIYATMIGTGNTTPKLGLDLQGGTTVTLKPVVTGGKIPKGALSTAIDIIRQRVNGFGVSEATVVQDGPNITISVPGKGRNSVVDQVGQTAELRFRQVYSQAAGQPTAAPKPTATPKAGTTATPSASASPKAGASVAPKAATPSATGTTRPEALSRALLAAPTPTPAAPKAAATPTPGATPTAAATATPSPAASAPAGTSSTTPPASVTAAFNKLVCTKDTVRATKPAQDLPNAWITACDTTLATKYLLYPAKVVGTDVKTATATIQQSGAGSTTVSTGEWEVDIQFTGKGQTRFTNLTAATVNDYVAIVLDGVVQSAPQIQTRIAGDATISGPGIDQKSATQLANVLKYGSLPITLQRETSESVSATLGRDSLHAGLLAGALGLLLVIIYSFIYYRALGLLTVASLSVSALLVYGTVVLLGQGIDFTLTLEGIAGLIVSVGVTADSFVVFYERLKDEAREGRSIRTSVDRGWIRARRTILSADTVSFLAAAALYFLSIGTVRGFAFTLGVSTLLDVVVVFLFTKPVMTLLVRKPFFSTGRFSGLNVRALGPTSTAVEAPTRSAPPRRNPPRGRTRTGAGREV